MNIQLIQGKFSEKDALEIITKIVQIKIKFHEDKIHSLTGEEDLKMREKRIKQLQSELKQVREEISEQKSGIVLDAVLHIQ